MNRAVINCEKLGNNVSKIKQAIPDDCKIIAVIKGDAYGYGLPGIAKELDHNNNVFIFAVASLEEALICIENKIKKRVLILNPVPDYYLQDILKKCEPEMIRKLESQLIFSAYSIEEVYAFEKISENYNIQMDLHIRLDFSGGCRGFTKDRFRNNIGKLFVENSNFKITGIYAQVYSFYYDNPELAESDMNKYISVLEDIPDEFGKNLLIHFLTSLSYLKYPKYCFDAVRIGAALYGMPISENKDFDSGLQEIMSISGKVLNVVYVNGESMLDYVGKCYEQSRKIAVISFGSWDTPNFFRGINTTVMIRNQLFNVIGSPCMDSCCVDVTDCPDIQPGDDVRILGEYEGISLKDKIIENNYNISNCQMMLSGINRIKKYYE